MAKDINPITEVEAMEILGLAKKTLRIYTIYPGTSKLPIRTARIGRKIFYSKSDIETYIQQKFHEKPVHKKTAVATAV